MVYDRSGIARNTKIVLFRALYLGDLLVAVPAFRALRHAYPHAEITLIGLPWAASFVRHVDAYIDRFLEFPGFPGIDEVEVDSERLARFLREQRAYGYDLAIQMHGSGETSNPFVLALGATLTAGYYRGERPASMTFAEPYPDDGRQIDCELGLARMVGCTDLDPRLEFPLRPSDRDEAREILGAHSAGIRPLIGIHPGSKLLPRRWPAASFAATADVLACRSGGHLVITGGPGEEQVAEEVAAHMTNRPLIAAGRTSVGGLGALIDEMDLFLSNDTGPAHLAQALGTPSVIVFGPSDDRRWGPPPDVGDRHLVVRAPVPYSSFAGQDTSFEDRRLDLLAPERVVAAAESLLGAGVRV
jgi:ADP-heptose:LPS heptosyltransferase